MIPEKTCYSIDGITPVLKESYRRFALVTHWEHMDQFGPNDEETLLVTSNWLLWQKCLNNGLHCAHTDLGLENWDSSYLDTNLFIASNDWLFKNSNKDPSLFHGVSLGRKFLKEISIVIADFERAQHSLEGLCGRFSPEEFVLYDYRTADGVLDSVQCHEIVMTVAKEKGIPVLERLSPSPRNDDEFPSKIAHTNNGQGSVSFRKSLTGWAYKIFDAFFCSLSRARLGISVKRPRVLLLNSQLTSVPLISEFDGRSVFPMLLSHWFPQKKNICFLLSSILKGVILIGAAKRPLLRADHKDIAEIRQGLSDILKDPTNKLEKFVQTYIRKNILETDRLTKIAEDVIWAKSLFDIYRPDHILTDGLQNTSIQIFLEIAKQNGVPATATWHAHWVQEHRLEIFGCDPRINALVSRCFTWGRVHEEWLDSIGAKVEKNRTGNLLISRLVNLKKLSSIKNGGIGKKALVLQYSSQYDDFSTKTCHEYQFFVETMLALSVLGFSEVRFKLHPGNRKKHYYKMIARHFGLNCELFDGGPFKEFINWADFAIGPAMSGAMIEFIASGKPYFPILQIPH
ncbi:MAG: hypothetical protein HON65_01215, partial [Rhodospirillales bacterium]|nr:hypothetical protein [Rhodospirillales bacterium]